MLFCEEDEKSKVSSLNILDDSEHFFIKNASNVYHHRTRNMNALTEKASTPIVVSYDVDAIVSPLALHKAIDNIRIGKSDVCNPYTSLRHLDQPQKNDFSKNLLVDNISEFRPYQAGWKKIINNFSDIVDLTPFTNQLAEEATGLIIVHDKENYFSYGGANENLLGHASEEMERYVRFVKMGAKWNRIDGPAYHMTHSREKNDYIRNIHYENNMKEIHRILSMSKASLSKYIKSWDWTYSESVKNSVSG